MALKIGHYRLGKTVGMGSFGEVKLATHDILEIKVAIKILNRDKIKSENMGEKVRREISILKIFTHPHIIRLYEVIDTPTDIFVVTEFVYGGDLFDYIVSKGRLSVNEARKFFQQIVSGVEFCHHHHVAHRDLKPENILLDQHNNVKIADFGLSNLMRDGDFLRTSCGSPNYAAPEVISALRYAGPEVDVWSCGVILYALLCGSLPFDDESIPKLFSKIKNGVYNMPSYLSESSRDLIDKMLMVDPMKRISISGITQHIWYTMNLPSYLKLSPDMIAKKVKQIDEQVVEDIVRLPFGRLGGQGTKESAKTEQTVESIQCGDRNELRVAYNLISDKKHAAQQNADLQQAVAAAEQSGDDEQMFVLRSPGFGQQMPSDAAAAAEAAVAQARHHRQKLDSKRRRWYLGIQSKKEPAAVMTEVYNALGWLGCQWKRIDAYWVRVLWCPTTQAQTQAQARDTTGLGDGQKEYVKIGLQLYKVQQSIYLLDFQKLEGNAFSFMQLCAMIVSALKTLSAMNRGKAPSAGSVAGGAAQ